MVELPDHIARALNQQGARIPSLPLAAAQAIQLASDPEVSLKRLATVIESDPALVSAVLRVSNSAFYRLSDTGGIANVTRAITRLGVGEIRRVCLSAAVVSAFPIKAKEPSLDRALFWKHSACCGVASRRLVEGLHIATDGEEFPAGVLHDVGKLILDIVFHEDYARAIALTNETGCSMRSAELEIFGVDHAQVSAWLCERWELPKALVHAVQFHHEPEASTGDPLLAAVVYVADIFARVTGNGFGGEQTAVAVTDTDAWRIVTERVPTPDVELLFFQISEEMHQSADMFAAGQA